MSGRENYLLAKIERLEEGNKILLVEEIQEGCNRCTEYCSLTPFSEKYRDLKHQIIRLKESQKILAQEIIEWRSRFNECTIELSEVTGKIRIQVIEDTIENIIQKSEIENE